MKSPVIGLLFEVQNLESVEGVTKETYKEMIEENIGSMKIEDKVFDFFLNTTNYMGVTEGREKPQIFINNYNMNSEFMIETMGQESFTKLWKSTAKNFENKDLGDIWITLTNMEKDIFLELKLLKAYMYCQREGVEVELGVSKAELL